ncbi:hypothetical protein Mapa_008365 [Marchantia paleacea]|nr:hypothetical protein Mapa_008365 [Marchantia paleacea]
MFKDILGLLCTACTGTCGASAHPMAECESSSRHNCKRSLFEVPFTTLRIVSALDQLPPAEANSSDVEDRK